MGSRTSPLLCLALLLAVSSAHAFDITQLLGQYPEFSSFNKYLTETKLADQVNSRNTITVLVVENGALSAVSGKSPQAIKAIISSHVILDYFDEKKLMEAQGSSQQLTTLYQASGLAVDQQGFLKVALVGEGEIAFGSAVSGAPVDVELVRTVTSEPYNISILQVSKPITFPGVDSQAPSPPSNAQSQPPQGAKTPAQGAAKAPQAAKAPAAGTQTPPVPAQAAKDPVPAQGAKAPAAGTQTPPVPAQAPKTPAPIQSAKAPVPAQGAKAPAPAKGQATAPAPSGEVAADAPVTADAPAAEAPVATSPTAAQAPGPVAGEADAADVPSSSSSRSKISLIGAVMGFASLLVVL
ncbi:FAS1 domain [Sesbania bispinosa]|nr:FAS1 domain [Sesbania bispinosa]